MRKSVIYIVLLLLSGAFAFAQQPLTLHYDKPAENWNEALPIGNGRLGAMIFGGTNEEVLQLNENTLYSGEPTTLWKGTKITDTYDYVVELLRNEKYAEATDFVRKNWLGRLHQNYQPLGELRFTNNVKGDAKNYKRELNIANAVQRTTFQQNGVSYTREIFASHPDDVIVVKFTADKKNSLDISIAYKASHPNVTFGNQSDILSMSGQAPGHAERRTVKQLEDWRVQYRHPELFYPDGSRRYNKRVLYGDEIEGRGMFFESRLKVIAPNANIVKTDNGLRISNTDEIVFVFSSATSYNGFDKSPSREGRDAKKLADEALQKATAKNYNDLKNAHISDYRNLFDRVKFTMATDKKTASLTTDKRIENYAQKQDNDLVTLLYQYGRYLMISGSRAGGQPLNLQGLWNNSVIPPWNGAYTMNINAQMNYWPAESANLSECHEPLFRLIKELAVSGTETARLMYGRKGWVGHHNTSIWRETYPNDGTSHSAYWPMVSAWLCSHLWEHYQFTGDASFLRDEAYPIMKSATEFFTDWLVDNGEGYLVTPVSTSPENEFRAPDGKRASVSMGATMDMALIRELFSTTINASEKLGIDEKHSTLLKEKLAKLLPYRVGAEGQLQEWQQDFKEIERTHRHVSHLYGLHPGNDINVLKDAKLTNAILKTMEIRGDEATGWSMGWKINLWARLLDGDHANIIIRNLFTPIGFGERKHNGGGLYKNMFDAHPPFQIDGNFGYTAGINEMLLQSQHGELHFLPALPTSWKAGKIAGIKARGNFEVAIEWANGQLKSGEVKSILGNKCVIRTATPIKISGAKASLKRDGKYYLYEFETEKGKVYSVK